MTNLPITGPFNVTQEYGRKSDNYSTGYHTGIDLVATNRNIFATGNGTVHSIVYNNKYYGNYIILKIADTLHYFCHLEKIYVTSGQTVDRTTKIGYMGTTGNSTGVHLHYEIRTLANIYGKDFNPADYMGIPNQVGQYDSKDYPVQNEDFYYKVGTVYTLQVALNVRTGAGTTYPKKSKSELTADGQKNSNSSGVLNSGTRVTCLEIAKENSNTWIRTPSGWLAGYYSNKYYIK